MNTSKKETYIQELKEKGWRVHPSAQGFSIYLRIDHAESILVDLIEDLKKMTVKKTAIAC
ncbi:MAG: hypothetical protein ACOYK9_04300 [Chlamydiia bacterium]